MGEKKAKYYIVPEGETVGDAIGARTVVAGPCLSKSEAMAEAAKQKDTLSGSFALVKVHETVVGTFAVAPVTVAAFIRS